MPAPPDVTALVYDELRALARRFLADERANHTLQTTALAHEVILRLQEDRSARKANRHEYLTHASRAIRRILVDHARRRGRLKRGGSATEVSFDESEHATAPFDVVSVSTLLDDLEQVDAIQAQVVELRVFGGLTFAKIGATLGISTGTAHREWRMARAWILDELEQAR